MKVQTGGLDEPEEGSELPEPEYYPRMVRKALVVHRPNEESRIASVFVRVSDEKDEESRYDGQTFRNANFLDLLSEIQMRAGINKSVRRLFSPAGKRIYTVGEALRLGEVLALCPGEQPPWRTGHPQKARKVRKKSTISLPKEEFQPPRPESVRLVLRRALPSGEAGPKNIVRLPKPLLKPQLGTEVVERLSRILGSVEALFDHSSRRPITDPCQLHSCRHLLYCLAGDPWPRPCR